MKRIAIIGGGLTGLACAMELVDHGGEVTIYEAGSECGGLAKGFTASGWKWHLESFYHHIFTNDKEIFSLARKVGAVVGVKRPLTTSWFEGKEIPLDSPLSLIKFQGISLWGRVRMGVGLLLLRLIPNGLFLERFKVSKVLPKLLGREGYHKIWAKLLSAKFGRFASTVNMAWFWSRIAKRTASLGYIEGSFSELVKKTEDYIEKNGGRILKNSKITAISAANNKGRTVKVNDEFYDAVVMTTPAPISQRIIKDLRVPKINYLWGQTVVLESSMPIINGYWMNVLDKGYPFLVVVEQTNMIDREVYGNNHIIYLGNYLSDDDRQLRMTKNELVEMYLPYLEEINPGFIKSQIKSSFVFRERYAQPVFPINYSKVLPKTRVAKGLYVANMSMVYPFDRGTNYAVEIGARVARQVCKDLAIVNK